MDEIEPTSDAAVLAEVERRLLTRGFSGSEGPAALLEDDFVEFGRSGRVYTKAQTLVALAAEQRTRAWVADLDDLATRLLSPDLALLTYTSVRRYDGGQAGRRTLRSSLWRKTAGRWRMLFHQATPMASWDGGSEPSER